jgi:hypothetical protein
MAITASGLYTQNMIDSFDASNLNIDLSVVTHRLSLISDTHTPNFDTDVTWNSTNEVAGTGWATPGVLLSAAAAGGTSTAPTLTISPAGTMMYDMTDVSVASTTITNAMAVRLYADAIAAPTADPLILLIDFITAFSTVNGTFGIQFAATGVFTVDWTP